MDAFVNNVLEKLKLNKQKYDELMEMVCSPEIIAHNKLYLRLCAQMNSLFESVSIYQEILNAQDEQKEKLALKANRLLFDLEHDEDNSNAQIILKAQNNSSLEFCQKLAQMYRNFASINAFSIIKDEQNGLQTELTIKGAFSTLKNENGLHKSNANECKITVLKMLDTPQISINPDEIRLDLFHSSGAGGQNVNKVQSAVRMTHIPTQIVVTCQDNRSQLANKEQAKKTLYERVAAHYIKQSEEEFLAHKKERLAIKTKIRHYDFTLDIAQDFKSGAKLPLNRVLKGEIDLFLEGSCP